MSFKAKLEPEQALVGNPIRVVIETKNEDSVNILLTSEGDTIFEGTAVPDQTGKCTFDINDILQTLLHPLIPSAGDLLLVQIPDAFIQYQVTVSGKTQTEELAGECYIGGISCRAFRQLAAAGTDIFQAKLLNPRVNFFLTTRTAKETIFIRETELGYLSFISRQIPLQISDLYGHTIELKSPTAGIYALNLPAIRQHFLRTEGVLVSYLRISVKGKAVVAVAITAGSSDAAILQFRNSYGCNEKIELSGVVTIQPEMAKQTVNNVFDDLLRNFTQTAGRGDAQPVMTIESGYKTRQELDFIQDLFLSDDICLLDGNERIKIMVSSGKMKYKKNLDEPISIEIKITCSDKEKYFTPGIHTNALSVLTDKQHIPVTTADNNKIIIKNKNHE